MEIQIVSVEPKPGQEVCDLCFGRPVTWRYPCESFIGPEETIGDRVWVHEMVADWAACDVCHDLIEADRREELAERAYHSENAPPEWRLIKLQIPKSELMAHFRVLHDQFFYHRKGAAIPLRTAA